MKGRETKQAPSADLLVCFPTRAHLNLIPKPICSPARPSESSKLHHHRRRHHHRRHSSRGGGANGHASPHLWAKTKPNSGDSSEPTSPKVTCAGQIKVRTKQPSSCKNWQSVMEEIERLHNNRKQKKKSAWIEAFGFKKDVMQFLTCLRNIRFDFRCFGSIPAVEATSDDEEDEEDDQEVQKYQENSGDGQDSRDMFSKWFMILQENNVGKEFDKGLVDDEAVAEVVAAPPPNALLLMRCRSAPAKRWMEEKEEEEISEESEEDEAKVMENGKKKKTNLSEFFIEAENRNRTGGIQDNISRSRSWKR